MMLQNFDSISQWNCTYCFVTSSNIDFLLQLTNLHVFTLVFLHSFCFRTTNLFYSVACVLNMNELFLSMSVLFEKWLSWLEVGEQWGARISFCAQTFFYYECVSLHSGQGFYRELKWRIWEAS